MAFFDALRASRVPAAGLAAIGLFWGGMAAWLPEIKARCGVTDAQFGLLMMLSALGGITAMSLAPRLSARIGPRLLPLSALAVAAAAILPALVQSAAGLGLALLAIGFAMSLCDILSNIRISDIEAQAGRSLQNLNHAIFSLALGATAALMGLLRGAGWAHLPAALLVIAGVLGCAALMRARRAPGEAAAGAPATTGRVALAPWAVILPGALILWLSFVTENGVETWAAIHIERTLGAGGGHGAFGPAMFGLTMGLTRLAGQVLTRVLGEVRLIALSVCMALAGAVLLAAAPGLTAAIAGAAALGLGVAVVVPTTNSLIARSVPESERPSAISRAWMLGFTGFFIGPPVMGLVSGTLGMRSAFGLIAVMVALMLPCLAAMRRRLLW